MVNSWCVFENTALRTKIGDHSGISSGICQKITYDSGCRNMNGCFQCKQKWPHAAMVIIMSPSVPLTTKITARVWYCQTVEPEMIWGSHSSRDAGIALYPLQPSLAQRLSAPPHQSHTGNPTVAPPKRLWAPPVLPALNSALKNHRSTYKKKKFQSLLPK